MLVIGHDVLTQAWTILWLLMSFLLLVLHVVDELERLVFAVPQATMSESTFTAYEELVRPVTREGRADVVGIGVLFGLWTGSRAMKRVLDTISIAYDLDALPALEQKLEAAIEALIARRARLALQAATGPSL